MPTTLTDLPHFTVSEIRFEGNDRVLVGAFDTLEGVRDGRCWLYVSETESLIGDLQGLSPETHAAEFIDPFWEEDRHAKIGTSFPWVEGYWQAFHVSMILDQNSSWQLREYRPSDAVATHSEGSRVLSKQSGPATELPAGAEIIRNGWDHEHCELCSTRIGSGGAVTGYVDAKDRWLCSECYEHFAKERDLSFLKAV